jgi:hypothetical protein
VEKLVAVRAQHDRNLWYYRFIIKWAETCHGTRTE